MNQTHKKRAGSRIVRNDKMTAASRQQAAAGRINPNWLHYGAAALLGAIVVGNILRWGILGQYMDRSRWTGKIRD